MNMMPAIDMAATGRNIENLRKAAGLSVRDLQEIFGFGTPQAIYKRQHGLFKAGMHGSSPAGII